MWFNSLGLGYQLNRPVERWVPVVLPVLECHVSTPLRHQNPDDPYYFQNQVNLTGVVHFLFRKTTLSTAVVVPTVGPRPFQVEGSATLTFRY